MASETHSPEQRRARIEAEAKALRDQRDAKLRAAIPIEPEVTELEPGDFEIISVTDDTDKDDDEPDLPIVVEDVDATDFEPVTAQLPRQIRDSSKVVPTKPTTTPPRQRTTPHGLPTINVGPDEPAASTEEQTTPPSSTTKSTQPLSTVRPRSDSTEEIKRKIKILQDIRDNIARKSAKTTGDGVHVGKTLVAEEREIAKPSDDVARLLAELQNDTNQPTQGSETPPPLTETEPIRNPYDYSIVLWPLNTAETEANRGARRTTGEIPGFVSYVGETTAGGPANKLPNKRNEDAYVTLVDPEGNYSAFLIDGSSDSGSKSGVTHPGYVAAEVGIGSFVQQTNNGTHTSLTDIVNAVSGEILSHDAWKDETDPNKRGYACGAAIRIDKKTRMIEMVGAGDTRALLFSQDGTLKAATEMQNLAAAHTNGDTELSLLRPSKEQSTVLNTLGSSLGDVGEAHFKQITDKNVTKLDTHEVPSTFGDVAILFSDGVGDVISETELSDLVAQYSHNPAQLQEEILHLAYHRNNLTRGVSYEMKTKNGTKITRESSGKGDNITVHVTRIEIPSVAPIVPKTQAQQLQKKLSNIPTPQQPPTRESQAIQIIPTNAPVKQPLWKHVGKWAAGVALAGTAMFGIFGGKEKRSEQSEPESPAQIAQTVDTPDANRLAPEMNFADDEGFIAETTTATAPQNEMVSTDEEVGDFRDEPQQHEHEDVPPTRINRQHSTEATGVDSPEVQRALRHIEERGGDQQNTDRVARVIAGERGRMTAERIANKAQIVGDLSTLNETPPRRIPIEIPAPNLSRYAVRAPLERTHVALVPVPRPPEIAPTNIPTPESDDDIIELDDSDLEEITPENPPQPNQVAPTTQAEQPRSEQTPYQYNGPSIDYLNSRLGLTLEKIAQQYPNGIQNLPPQTIRDLRYRLRANSPTLIDWIRINRAFETMLRGE